MTSLFKMDSLRNSTLRLFSLFICAFIALFYFSNLEAKVHMGIITASNYVGDREVAWRIKIAAEALGWKVFLDENEGNSLKKLKLDWVICMLPGNRFSASYPNYLMVFHPFSYLDENRHFFPAYEKYDGYLLTIKDRQTLEEPLRKKGKTFHYMTFYPSVYSTPYQKLDLKDLVVMIPVWSNRLSDPKFKLMYQLLSETGVAKFYGVHRNEDIITEGYLGSIPFDGASVLDILQQHGIVLVFHSDIHNNEGIPSSRIFEAAAASTVIISDENPFVKKHFGDSVFYINTSVSGEEIFNQIQAHLNTIRRNPEKALAMAKAAHSIFIENFTMENQLLNLQAMHQKIISKKKG